MTQQLEQLDKEIADVIAMADDAQQAYQSERHPERQARLQEAWQQCLKEKEMLIAVLLPQRRALESQLKIAGMCIPLPSNTAQCELLKP